MEISIGAISIAIFGVMTLTCVWRFVSWVWLNPKKLEKYMREQGFDGNSYRFFSGDLKEETMMKIQATTQPMNFSHDIVPRVVPFLDQTVKKYGKKCFQWTGPKLMVHIMDSELLKVMFTEIYEFRKPDPGPLGKLLLNGLGSSEGERWVTHRKILNPAFRLDRLKNMILEFEQSCVDMISKWEILIEGKSGELDVWPYLQACSKDAISRTAFGSRFEDGRKIFDLINEITTLVLQAAQNVYVPGWRFIPTKLNRRLPEAHNELKKLVISIINEKETAIIRGEATNEDMLSILLQSNKELKENGKDNGHAMTLEDIIEECKVFYTAGQDTTSSLLVWTMILLSKHQEWQERARAEVLKVFGSDKPNYEGLRHLKVVTMILYEVLRLYPPAIQTARRVDTERKLGNITIPAGTMLSLPIILNHHDHETWGDDVHEFKPERFSDGFSKATNNNITFYPFGSGARSCIGQNFSLLEGKLVFSMILQMFSFELSPSYTHAPYTFFTLQPQHGAHLILHKLK